MIQSVRNDSLHFAINIQITLMLQTKVKGSPQVAGKPTASNINAHKVQLQAWISRQKRSFVPDDLLIPNASDYTIITDLRTFCDKMRLHFMWAELH